MKTLLAVMAMTAVASAAQAATISFQYGLPLVESTTEINQTGLLNKFNVPAGTLTGASLEIFGAATTTITLTNNAAQSQNARATASVDLAWSSTLGGLDAILADDISLAFTTGAAQSYATGQSRTFGPLTDTGGFTYDLSSILASLTGAGTFDINCESLSGVNVIGGGGNVRSAQTTTAGCGARVTYTYNAAPPPPAIPEPGTLALVALALAGVGAARRRRAA